jgi:hypothetical protein
LLRSSILLSVCICKKSIATTMFKQDAHNSSTFVESYFRTDCNFDFKSVVEDGSVYFSQETVAVDVRRQISHALAFRGPRAVSMVTNGIFNTKSIILSINQLNTHEKSNTIFSRIRILSSAKVRNTKFCKSSKFEFNLELETSIGVPVHEFLFVIEHIEFEF